MPERRLALVNSLSSHFANAGHSMVWAFPHRAAFFFGDARKAGQFEEGLENFWRDTAEYKAGNGSPKFTHYSSGNNVIVHFDDKALGKSVWDEVAKNEKFAADPKNVFPLQTKPLKQTALAKMFRKVLASPEALVRFHEEAARANDASVKHLRKVGGGLERGELSKEAEELLRLSEYVRQGKEIAPFTLKLMTALGGAFGFIPPFNVGNFALLLPLTILGGAPYAQVPLGKLSVRSLVKKSPGLPSELALNEILEKHAPLEIKDREVASSSQGFPRRAYKVGLTQTELSEKRMERRRIIGEAIRQLQEQQAFHETRAEELERKLAEEKEARKKTPYHGVPPWT